jgi:hypothetical protein
MISSCWSCGAGEQTGKGAAGKSEGAGVDGVGGGGGARGAKSPGYPVAMAKRRGQDLRLPAASQTSGLRFQGRHSSAGFRRCRSLIDDGCAAGT